MCPQLARITLTPHTLAFFLISVIHCVAQGLTAAFIYSEDASSFKFVNDVVYTSDVPNNEVARLFRVGNNLELRLCTAIPLGTVFKDCETIYTTDPNANYNVSLAPVERFLADVEGAQSSVRRHLSFDVPPSYIAVVWHTRFTLLGGDLMTPR